MHGEQDAVPVRKLHTCDNDSQVLNVVGLAAVDQVPDVSQHALVETVVGPRRKEAAVHAQRQRVAPPAVSIVLEVRHQPSLRGQGTVQTELRTRAAVD